MPDEVEDYFLEHRKHLAAGANESLRAERWIWKDLDPAQASAWCRDTQVGAGDALTLDARPSLTAARQ
jgi:hypothetical protein